MPALQIQRTRTVRKEPYGGGMTHRTGHVNDFDFLAGDWHVAHRRLMKRWVRSNDWDEFSSTSRCEPRLGGVANVEQIDCPDLGFSGMTVRVFNLPDRQWSIYWVNSTVGRLEPPVIGGFEGNVGIFEGPDSDEGEPINVRFTWTVIDDEHARWQQAFSRNNDIWETNWIMEFTRK
jgi:hypothetical protein